MMVIRAGRMKNGPCDAQAAQVWRSAHLWLSHRPLRPGARPHPRCRRRHIQLGRQDMDVPWTQRHARPADGLRARPQTRAQAAGCSEGEPACGQRLRVAGGGRAWLQPLTVHSLGRYVDDMVLVHPSKELLLEVRQLIGQWLDGRGLRLHPRKMYLQHYGKGVMFVGGMIKPGRKYISRRTCGRLYARIYQYNQRLAAAAPTREQLEGIVATLNSYLGMMCHYNALYLFRRVLRHVAREWYRYAYFSRRGRRVKAVLRQAA